MNILFFGASSQIARSISKNIKFKIYGISKKNFKHNYISLYKISNYSKREIKRVLNKKKIKFDHIIFFNGIYEHSLLRNYDKEDFYNVLNVNFSTIISSALTIIENKFLKEHGSICFISSKAADNIELGNAYYSLTKKLLNISAKLLSKEFRNLYRFNCISSGFIKSKMSDEILNYYTSEQKKNILKRQNNLFIPKSKLIKTIYSLCYNNKINGKVIKLHR